MEPFEADALFKKRLEFLKRENLYRERIVPPEGVKVLCSNNYLNLSRHPGVVEASIEAAKRCGTGSGASALVSGYGNLHRLLELETARYKETPACLTVGSGFLANVGLFSALAGEGDLILSDRLNHASIIDGVRLSKAKRVIYPHKDTAFIERFLQEHRPEFKSCLLVTDGVFSMDGDVAPLDKLYKLAEKFGCFLIIDDAHTTAAVERSSLHLFKLDWKPFVIEIGTYSKALGSYGAFICGSAALVEYLVNTLRSYIFSTALPPTVIAASLAALGVVQKEPSLVKRLRALSLWIKEELKSAGFDLGLSDEITPIVPIMVGDEEKALKLRNRLLERGYFVQAIRYPTVEKGKARLRLTVSLEHPPEVYSDFLKNLKEVY
jgi:8-amino-7-oxononanoate synthase